MEANIRGLTSEDLDETLQLITRTERFSEAEVAIAEELIDICIHQPDQKDYYAFIAECNEVGNGLPRVAGFLLLGPTPATVGTYDMYWIAVDPAFQGSGIAQRLDAFAEAFVRERNGYWIIAETSSQPLYARTRKFYEKEGYSILAQIPDYYKPSDDLIIYGKRLS